MEDTDLATIAEEAWLAHTLTWGSVGSCLDHSFGCVCVIHRAEVLIFRVNECIKG